MRASAEDRSFLEGSGHALLCKTLFLAFWRIFVAFCFWKEFSRLDFFISLRTSPVSALLALSDPLLPTDLETKT